MDMDFGNRPVAIKALVGSHASNLQTPEFDKDWKYFVTPTFDDLYSEKMFSAANQSETFDYDVHDIRKLGSLLWKSNVNFIVVLFSPQVECNPGLQWIFDNADRYGDMNLPYLYSATMGMHYEKMKTLDKGTFKTNVLVSTYGYDTKQATHALRCLYLLNRIASGMSVREAFWFDGIDRQMLLGVKAGYFSEAEFREYVQNWRYIHDKSIKEWFAKQTAKEELGEELSQGIKTYIRINL